MPENSTFDGNESIIGFGDRLLKYGGISGLLAVMGMGFLMYVVYNGQQMMQVTHQRLLDIDTQILQEQEKATQILTDIRYGISASKGITFRNNSSSK